ncbi:MAG TPA: hypothetical protein VFI25_12090 [Planctomycetota bacterium]|nr:hypothetical protein [Planctomycetota bacterium]
MTTLFALSGILPLFLGAIPLGFLAIYLVLRWRDRDEPRRDPELGLKAALLSIRAYALLLALGGATAVVDWGLRAGFGVRRDSDEVGAGLGFLLAGTLVTLLGTWSLRRTNAAEFPRAARTFRGYLGAISGLIGASALAVALSALLTDQRGALLSVPWAVEIVWTAATLALLEPMTRPRADHLLPPPEKAAGTP